MKELEKTAHCTGTFEAPQAAPGYLCFYRSYFEFNVERILPGSAANGVYAPLMPETDGDFILVESKQGGEVASALGSWAVTAP